MLATNRMVDMTLLIILLIIFGENAYTETVHKMIDATEK